MSPEGLKHVDTIKNAVFEAIKGTPLEGSQIYLTGTATAFKDMQEGANYDLMIAGIAALWRVDPVEAAIRIHGGAGIMREYPVGRIHRDALVYVIGEGTSDIQRLLIAREIAKG